MLKTWIRPMLLSFTEHFSVYVARGSDRRVAAIRANPFSYYADPFVWRDGDDTWLLVEEFQYSKNKGRLCAIEIDAELNASLPQPILALGCHASFPFLFEVGGRLHMAPETCGQRTLDIYVCEQFPGRWRLSHRIMNDIDTADTVVFEHEDLWWLITSIRDPGVNPQRYLAVFFTHNFHRGLWSAHPINNERRFGRDRYGHGRNAGSIVRKDGQLVRMMQNNHRYYGESLNVMHIERLTPSEYSEVPFDGEDLIAEIAQRFSPHHISVCNDLVAWDVRDRVGYGQHVPLLRRWANQPSAKITSLASLKHLDVGQH